MEPLCQLRPTPYGGRGLFSTQRIPTGTTVHTCDSPYATVIYRVFRKEVCGHCFAYAFDAGRNAWNVKYDMAPGNGVWFCREDCRDAWNQHQNVHGLLARLNLIVDKASKRMKEPKVKRTTIELRPDEVTMEILDAAWQAAETWSIKPNLDFEYLNQMELDNARFLISAIIQRHCEDLGLESSPSSLNTSTPTWLALLELQSNELAHIRSRPDALASHLRIYRFLRRIMVPELYRYVEKSDMVRAIVSRDQGNVFGLWDMSTKGDSEMLGWSMYTSASFFNHDCAPNVRKERVGRAMIFRATRDIEPGEELCINYIDLQDSVVERQLQLSDNWYFSCICKRCEKELALCGVTN